MIEALVSFQWQGEASPQDSIHTPVLIVALEESMRREQRTVGPATITYVHIISPRRKRLPPALKEELG